MLSMRTIRLLVIPHWMTRKKFELLVLDKKCLLDYLRYFGRSGELEIAYFHCWGVVPA